MAANAGVRARPEVIPPAAQDRNRNKITSAEQDNFSRLTIGVVGPTAGHSVAHTPALEGLCGRLRLADNDSIALSNLNRIPATVFDVGVNKAIVAARRIAELDPYLPADVFTSGVTEQCLDDFLDGIDVVIEECDSLDMKVRVREEARACGIPVFMEASDRGLFDRGTVRRGTRASAVPRAAWWRPGKLPATPSHS